VTIALSWFDVEQIVAKDNVSRRRAEVKRSATFEAGVH